MNKGTSAGVKSAVVLVIAEHKQRAEIRDFCILNTIFNYYKLINIIFFALKYPKQS